MDNEVPGTPVWQQPMITVVTIVLNDCEAIERTIESVISQSYKKIEFVVVDGGSTDGTLQVIERYMDKIHRFVSGKDNGIYDAMNKGANLSMGEWVIFMNAGDSFYDKNSLEDIFSKGVGGAEVIFGDVEVLYKGFKRIRKTGGLDNIWWKGMPISHQSCLVKRRLLLEHPFDLKYALAADYEFLCWAWSNRKKISGSNKVIASVSSLGLSDIKRDKALSEFCDISSRYYDVGKARRYFFVKRLQNAIVSTAKMLLPSRTVAFITRIKYLLKR